jgi:hypothetical protein
MIPLEMRGEKVFNRDSKRWVLKTGAVGRRLLGEMSSSTTKDQVARSTKEQLITKINNLEWCPLRRIRKLENLSVDELSAMFDKCFAWNENRAENARRTKEWARVKSDRPQLPGFGGVRYIAEDITDGRVKTDKAAVKQVISIVCDLGARLLSEMNSAAFKELQRAVRSVFPVYQKPPLKRTVLKVGGKVIKSPVPIMFEGDTLRDVVLDVLVNPKSFPDNRLSSDAVQRLSADAHLSLSPKVADALTRLLDKIAYMIFDDAINSDDKATVITSRMVDVGLAEDRELMLALDG